MFRDLSGVIDKTDLKIIQDSAGDIVFVILMWGSLSTAIVGIGFERGIVYVFNLAMTCVMICFPVFLAVGVLFIDFPLILYARFVGKDSSQGSREILLGSLVSIFFLVAVGLYTGNLTFYENFLLLSSLNALYSPVGLVLYPKNQKLGLCFFRPFSCPLPTSCSWCSFRLPAEWK